MQSRIKIPCGPDENQKRHYFHSFIKKKQDLHYYKKEQMKCKMNVNAGLIINTPKNLVDYSESALKDVTRQA